MKYLSKKTMLLYLLILAFLIGRVFLFKVLPISKYTELVNPLFWLFMAILSYLMAMNEANIRQRGKVDVIQSVVIVMIVYSMLYFSLGLVFGYERSPYSHTLQSMIRNIWSFVVIIGFQEFARFQILKLSPKRIGFYGIVTALFIVAQIDFWSFTSNFSSNAETFKYFSQVLLPLLVSNCLFTYLALTSGNVSSTIYRGVLELLVILLPIYPSINWLIKSMMDIILVVIVALYVNYSDLRAARTIRKRELKKESIVSYIPFVIVLVLVVCFVGGMFKYQPIAVLSNSMYPTFSRGDAVIVEKINSKDINQLKKLEKGNILYFSKDGNLIIHRITAVEYESENRVLFHTKGDNNNSEDGWVVTNEEVLGTVKFMAPIVGYPSVLVNELLK